MLLCLIPFTTWTFKTFCNFYYIRSSDPSWYDIALSLITWSFFALPGLFESFVVPSWSLRRSWSFSWWIESVLVFPRNILPYLALSGCRYPSNSLLSVLYCTCLVCFGLFWPVLVTRTSRKTDVIIVTHLKQACQSAVTLSCDHSLSNHVLYHHATLYAWRHDKKRL